MPSEKKLREALIRLAHSKPELRGDLLPLLEKTASRDGVEILNRLMDRRAWAKLRSKLMKEDKGASSTLREIYLELAEALDPGQNGGAALNKFLNLISSGDKFSVDMIRNNLGQISNLLGMRTPIDF